MKIDNLGKTYKSCMSAGFIKEKIVDIELIKSLKFVAEKGLEFIANKSKDISKNSDEWTFVFREHYESLRMLIEAYLLFEGVAADNHQCKSAYICFKHPELALDWEFLEIIRLKRNVINYRGQMLKYDDWKILRLKFELYISVLKQELEKKLEKL